MKTKEQLLNMSIDELEKESSKHFAYVRKVDSLISYKKNWMVK